MKTIFLNSDTFMSSGLAKVRNKEYFDALVLFARVHTYEAQLNMIGCHCALGDVAYAQDLYRRLLAEYGTRYDCVADVRSLGDLPEEALMNVFGNDLNRGRFSTDSTKLRADKSLLGNYTYVDEFEDEDIYTSMMNSDRGMDLLNLFLRSSELRDDAAFDSDSEAYCNDLRDHFIRAKEKGDEEACEHYCDLFLDCITNDPVNLELQLGILYETGQWDRGNPIAMRMARSGVYTNAARRMAAEIMYRFGLYQTDDEVRDALLSLLDNALEEPDDIDPDDLVAFAQIAPHIKDADAQTSELTDELFNRHKECGCCALLLCARNYHNLLEHDLARTATRKLLEAAPWDSVARGMLHFINSDLRVLLSLPNLMRAREQRWDMPPELIATATARLSEFVNTNRPLPTSELYNLDVLFRGGLCAAYAKDPGNFVAALRVFEGCVEHLPAEGEQAFADFLKQEACTTMAEPMLASVVLGRLVKMGCKDKLYVSTPTSVEEVDLSQLPTDDEKFVGVFCLCACLQRCSVPSLQAAYTKLITLAPVAQRADVRTLAHAVLSIANKNFARTPANKFFADKERTLYKDYLTILKRQGD